MTGHTIYEHQLPPEGDPEVVSLATSWVDHARAAQRPGRAMAYAVPSTLLGIVLWGELNRWTGFDMHWYVMAGSAVVLGVLLGRPCRVLGALFDPRWAMLLGALGIVMGVLGDLYASTALLAVRAGTGWSDVIGLMGPAELHAWLTGRQPIDWLVAGLGGAGAFLSARPPLDARQLVMEARIEICRRRQVEDAGVADERAA